MDRTLALFERGEAGREVDVNRNVFRLDLDATS